MEEEEDIYDWNNLSEKLKQYLAARVKQQMLNGKLSHLDKKRSILPIP